MTRVLRPGWATMAGLTWLARVGPAPLDAWRCAMGWSEVAARSHARRLEREGWLARYPMRRGDGCLFVPTRVGVAVAGVPVRAPGEPAPTWWAHHCGVAWTAAWLTVRGREFKGGRELLEFDAWSGEISWQDHKGLPRVQAPPRPRRISPRRQADRGRGRAGAEVDRAPHGDPLPARRVAPRRQEQRRPLHLRRRRRTQADQEGCQHGPNLQVRRPRPHVDVARRDQAAGDRDARGRIRARSGSAARSPMLSGMAADKRKSSRKRERRPSGLRGPWTCSGSRAAVHRHVASRAPPPSATRRGRRRRRSRCSTPRRSSRPPGRASATRIRAPSAATSAQGFRELRPRAGRSRWRPIYRRVNPSTFVIFAVGPEAEIDSRGYDAAVVRGGRAIRAA